MTEAAGRVRKIGPGPVVLRELHVVRFARTTPRTMRVTLGGDQLEGFVSRAPDDHVVLFFVSDGQNVPTSEDPTRRPVWTERPPTRDYTPRRIDPAAGELDIDFVLHGAGVASSWAETTEVGARIVLSDPRTSFVAEGYAHHLLVGDESALPSIARRLEELPAGTHADVFLEVEDAAEEVPLPSAATTSITWCRRDSDQPGASNLLLDALRGSDLAPHDAYTWVAAETDVVRGIRHHLLAEHGFTPAHARFSGYWKAGHD